MFYLNSGKVSVSTVHALVGSGVFAAFFNDSTGFEFADQFVSPPNPPATTPFALTAGGEALQLLGRAISGATSVQKLSFTPNPYLSGCSGTYPLFIGWMFKRGTARQAFVVNLSDQSKTIATSAIFSSGGSYEQRFADPLTLVTGPGSVANASGALPATLTLAPYSVTRLSNAAP
ncbi:MAG: hypothetical protein ACREEM_07700 [Blastocatellia bacterium]